jgi:hypothetical protein
MKAITIRAADNPQEEKKAKEKPNLEKRAKATPPVKASTRG